jgi:hypothetical protein
MSERRFRKPNALKHGAFSEVEFLPWEDPAEFEELRRGLIEEHQPEGPLQQDCVNTILSCMWRKRRVRAKRNFDTAAALDRVENRVLWEDPPPLFDTAQEGTMHALSNRRSGAPQAPRDDYRQLLGFSTSLYGAQYKQLVELHRDMLPKEFSAHLREKVPLENFEETIHWIVALKKEVDNVLMPMVRNRDPQPSAYFETAADFLTGDRLIEDLDVEVRLDAGIDRALKRLWQLKMARQLHQAKEPKLIAGRSHKQLEHSDTIAQKPEE